MPSTPKKPRSRNEKTSSKVGAIAGKVLRALAHPLANKRLHQKPLIVCAWNGDEHLPGICTLAELKALAASALTQRPNRKPVGRSRKTAKR